MKKLINKTAVSIALSQCIVVTAVASDASNLTSAPTDLSTLVLLAVGLISLTVTRKRAR